MSDRLNICLSDTPKRCGVHSTKYGKIAKRAVQIRQMSALIATGIFRKVIQNRSAFADCTRSPNLHHSRHLANFRCYE